MREHVLMGSEKPLFWANADCDDRRGQSTIILCQPGALFGLALVLIDCALSKIQLSAVTYLPTGGLWSGFAVLSAFLVAPDVVCVVVLAEWSRKDRFRLLDLPAPYLAEKLSVL